MEPNLWLVILLFYSWKHFHMGGRIEMFSKASWVECTADLFLEVALVQGIP